MNAHNFFQTKKFSYLLYSIGACAVAFFIFHLGVEVGYHKASVSFRFGESYYQTFGDRGGGMFRDNLPPPGGVIGKIIKITLPTVVIEGADSVEKIVTLDDDTAIRHLRDTLAPTDLAVGNYVVVIGLPTDAGKVIARLVRVVPAPPSVLAPTSPIK